MLTIVDITHLCGGDLFHSFKPILNVLGERHEGILLI